MMMWDILETARSNHVVGTMRGAELILKAGCAEVQGRLEALVEERKKISVTDEQANEKAGKGAKKVSLHSNTFWKKAGALWC